MYNQVVTVNMYRSQMETGRTEVALIVAGSFVSGILGLIITKVHVIPPAWALPILLVGCGIVSIGLFDLSKKSPTGTLNSERRE